MEMGICNLFFKLLNYSPVPHINDNQYVYVVQLMLLAIPHNAKRFLYSLTHTHTHTHTHTEHRCKHTY